MFSLLRLDLLSFAVAVATSVILGFIVFFHNRKSATNVLFLIFALVSSLWGVLNYLAYQIYNPFISLWIVRVVMFLAVYQAFTFFLLMYIFPRKEFGLSRRFKYILFPVVIFVSILTLTPLVFSEVSIVRGSAPTPTPAAGILLFALVAVSFVLAGIVMMVKRALFGDIKTKSQFRTLSLGVILMFASIITFNFIFVVFLDNSSFIPFSGVFIIPFVIFTFYAILKHELLNVRIVATEILTLGLIVFTFVEVILSRSFIEIIFRSIVFFILLVVGIFFIRSVISEQKHREQLQNLTDKLKAMDKQKDEFISMAAHELRAPMTAIKGYVSMVLEGDTGDIPEKARGFLADANNINDRLIRLVNNMLNVGRIEEGRMVYQIEEENLSHAVRMVFSQFAPEAERKGLEYKLEIPNHIKDKVRVDPDRIQEVIGNFLSNAVKYTDKGFVKVRLSQQGSKHIRCEVIDSGPGISKEEQTRLFQKFHRVESNVGKTTGTGLGLFICKLLVEKFGGKIGLDSEPDKGSRFWFELPLVS
jgi:signal transduction histidine kinase